MRSSEKMLRPVNYKSIVWARFIFEHILNKMDRKYGVQAKLVTPYIPYRETIKGSAETESKYKKQSGGHGQYGHVKIQVDPLY